MRLMILALVVVALAGCSDSGDNAEPTETTTQTNTSATTSATTTGTTTQTMTTSPPQENETSNTPPAASISASVESGEAPVLVNFTLDGADADGDALTWTFDADADGTFDAEGSELPADVSFEYASEGTYNATLVVSDGANETLAQVTIDATAAAGGQGPVQTVSGSWIGGPSGCYETIVVGDLAGTENLRFDVEPASIGTSFQADFTAADTVQRYYLIFWTADIDVAGAFESDSPMLSGVVPADANYARAATCLGGESTFDYVAG